MSKETAPLPFSRLPDLLERLYDSLASFLDAKLALFRKEVWEEGQSLIRRGLGVAAAGVVALVGFMVINRGIGLRFGHPNRKPSLILSGRRCACIS